MKLKTPKLNKNQVVWIVSNIEMHGTYTGWHFITLTVNYIVCSPRLKPQT